MVVCERLPMVVRHPAIALEKARVQFRRALRMGNSRRRALRPGPRPGGPFVGLRKQSFRPARCLADSCRRYRAQALLFSFPSRLIRAVWTASIGKLQGELTHRRRSVIVRSRRRHNLGELRLVLQLDALPPRSSRSLMRYQKGWIAAPSMSIAIRVHGAQAAPPWL